jgi:hypothetical protein
MTPTAAPASLDDVLASRHAGVVRRYLKEHGGTLAEAEELFGEMLKWLYLCDRAAEEGFALAMTPDLKRIDWMWPAFVLFTRAYAEFCHCHSGSDDADSRALGESRPGQVVVGRRIACALARRVWNIIARSLRCRTMSPVAVAIEPRQSFVRERPARTVA